MSTIIRAAFAPARMKRETAAYYLDCSIRELDGLREKNEITRYGTGKNVYFLKSELDEYIARMPERMS